MNAGSQILEEKGKRRQLLMRSRFTTRPKEVRFYDGEGLLKG